MESNFKRKPGRPAKGELRDGVLFIRLPKSKKEYVKKFVGDFLDGRGWVFNPEWLAAAKKPHQDIPPYKGDEELKELRKHNKELIDNVVELTKERDGLLRDVSELEVMDLDEKGKLGWKLYYETKNKRNEFDQE